MIDYPAKVQCCGSSLLIPDVDIALGLMRKILESATTNGAQCLIAVCPLCQTALDVYQGMVNHKFHTNYQLPVLFFTQLIGLAIGVDPKKLGLEQGAVSADKILAPFVKARA